jgi:hypothetical protein
MIFSYSKSTLRYKVDDYKNRNQMFFEIFFKRTIMASIYSISSKISPQDFELLKNIRTFAVRFWRSIAKSLKKFTRFKKNTVENAYYTTISKKR